MKLINNWGTNKSSEVTAPQPEESPSQNAGVLLAPLQLVRSSREIEDALSHLEQVVQSEMESEAIREIGQRFLSSSRELSVKLQRGLEALHAAHALTQATVTAKSVIVDFIQDRLATYGNYGNPFCMVLFHLDEAEDCRDALSILCRLIRVTDRAYLMSDHELVVMLPETMLAGGRVFGCRAVAQLVDELGVRAFAGIAAAVPGDDVTNLLKRTDEALYQARQDEFLFAYCHDGESVEPCEDSPTS